MSSKKRLGRGLEELLGADVDGFINDLEKNYSKDEVVNINLEEIHPNPFQPRRVFDESKIEELGQSIKEHGVFTPIILNKTKLGYNIVAGERRYRASQSIGAETIPAIIIDIDETLMMEIALLENIQRENLNPIEEAQAIKNIMEYNKYTQEEIAKKVGKSRSHIANMLRLLTLNDKVQELILMDKISMGHAKVLVGVDEENLDILVKKIPQENLSVRDTEELVKKLKGSTPTTKKISKDELPLEYKEIENKLREKLDTKVSINKNNININFEDEETLSKIIKYFGIVID